MSQIWPSRLFLSSLALLSLALLPACGHFLSGSNAVNAIPPWNAYATCAVADFNGDGMPDIALSYARMADVPPHPGTVAVYLQDRNHPGSFLSPTNYPVPNDPWNIVAADLNEDGNIDLAVVNTIATIDTIGSSSVSVLLQDPANPGEFFSAVNYDTGYAPVALAVGDVTQDGRTDIVVSNADGITVLLQSSTTPGQFQRQPTIAVPNGGTAGIAIADVNGDGKNDIIATAADLMVYLQNLSSPGSFLAPVHYTVGAQPYAVIAQDLNGDGRPDLAVANLGSADGSVKANLSVLLQNLSTPGTFLLATNYTTDVRSWTIASGDLDGDGKPDLVVGNMGSFDGGSISIFFQDPAAPGTFQPELTYSEDNVSWAIPADINNDGKQELVIVSSGLEIRYQDPAQPGSFLPPVVIVSP
jgi:hypothetical protein